MAILRYYFFPYEHLLVIGFGSPKNLEGLPVSEVDDDISFHDSPDALLKITKQYISQNHPHDEWG